MGEEEAKDGTTSLVKHPDQIWYRLSLSAAEPWKKIALVRQPLAASSSAITDAKYLLHAAALPLPPKKVRDLAKFKQWLPKEFHSLYPDPKAVANDEVEEVLVSDEDQQEDERAAGNRYG